MLLACSYHPSSSSFGLDRIRTFHPVGHIDIMNMLLHNMVTTKPVEVIPVSHLVFHLGLPCLTWSNPYSTIVPIHLAPKNITYSSILDPINGLNIVGLVPSLQARHHVKLFGFGYFCGRQYPTDTMGVRSDRFFQKHMLALTNCFLKVVRPKTWRCCQQHHISQSYRLLISIKTYKFMFFRNVYFIRMPACNGFVTAIQSVSKSICHCYQFYVMACSQSLEYSSGASSATTDHRYFNFVTACCISTRHSEWTQ